MILLKVVSIEGTTNFVKDIHIYVIEKIVYFVTEVIRYTAYVHVVLGLIIFVIYVIYTEIPVF